jgi:ABC-type amino acid transport substrate-binding protein
MCSDYQQFKDLFSSKVTKAHDLLLVVLLKSTYKQCEIIFQVMWSNRILNVNIMTRFDNTTCLLAFVPFNQIICNDTSPLVLGNFINGSWTLLNQVSKRFANLHQCSIKVNALNNSPIVMKTVLPNGTVEFSGIEVKLLREAAKALNFKVQLDSFDTDHGLIFERNNSASGNIRHAITGDADAVLGSYYLTQDRAKYLSHTQAYRMDAMKVVGARDLPYSPIEKLLRPLTFWLFLGLFVTLLFGFASIFFLQNRELQDSSLRHLNLVSVFLGVSLVSPPKKTYLRILFLSFSFFCINIQTIYQGSLFNLMQTDDVKKGISTINEMIDEGFSFYVSTTFGETTKEMKFHHR